MSSRDALHRATSAASPSRSRRGRRCCRSRRRTPPSPGREAVIGVSAPVWPPVVQSANTCRFVPLTVNGPSSRDSSSPDSSSASGFSIVSPPVSWSPWTTISVPGWLRAKSTASLTVASSAAPGLDHQPGVVLVRHLVDRLLLDQHEEAVAVLAEDVERLGRHLGQRDGRARRGRRGPPRGARTSPRWRTGRAAWGRAPCVSAGAVGHVAVAELLGAVDEVALVALARLGRVGRRVVGQRAGVALRVPVVLAAAEDHVGLGALEVLARDLALLRAVGDVRGVRGGRRVGHLRRGDEPGRLAGPARVLEQGADRLAGRVDADGAVEGLHAGRERGRRGGGVGDRLAPGRPDRCARARRDRACSWPGPGPSCCRP